MFGRKKDPLKELEGAIKHNIGEIKKLPDAGERLLRFRELQGDVRKVFNKRDTDDLIKWSNSDFHKATAFIGICLPVVGALIPVGVMAIFNMKASDATKHANKLESLLDKIDGEIGSLTSARHIEDIVASPHAGELRDKFPDLEGSFRRWESEVAARRRISGKKAPEKEAKKEPPIRGSGPIL